MKPNRKQRFKARKLKRQKKSNSISDRGPSHWVRRIALEMQDNKNVINKVLDGKLDIYLKN